MAPRKGKKAKSAVQSILDENRLAPPRAVAQLIGHRAAVESFERAFASGRLAHGWMLCGQEGVGKATLAYHLARRLLKWQPGDSGLPPVAEGDPIFRRVMQGSHSDLKVIEPETPGGVIKVEEVRGLQHFLAHTAGEAHWRVVIVDPADAMNISSANAILKLLEEPPPRTVLFMVTHRPARLLPTIRSRCRQLLVPAMEQGDFLTILSASGLDIPPAEASLLTTLAEGSPGLALKLLVGEAPARYAEWLELWKAKSLQPGKVMEFADKVANKDLPEAWMGFRQSVSLFLSRLIRSLATGESPPPLAEGEAEVLKKLAARHSQPLWLQFWEDIQRILDETERVNLDKRLTVQHIAYLLENGAS